MLAIKLNLKKAFLIFCFAAYFLSLSSLLRAEEVVLSQSLVEAPGKELVVGNCTVCHSESIILQNHMDRRGWDETIDWMQKEQGMWELEKKDRNIILNYLSKYQNVVSGKGAKQNSKRRNQMFEFDYKPNPL